MIPVSSIEVRGLSVSVGTKRLVGPISFRIDQGQTLVIMGETGAGKSLIAQAILGTLPDELTAEGEILLDDARIDTLDACERSAFWGRRIAMLPQEPWRALDPLMRSGTQVSEAHRYVSGLSRAAGKTAMEEDFGTLGLAGAEPKVPGILSGGMAQRVAYAAATAGGAPVLLADEPTKGLDADRTETIVSLLAKVPKDGGILLAITHDTTVARKLGGEALVLKNGTEIERGPVDQIMRAPSHAYTQALLNAEPSAWPKQSKTSPGETVLTATDISVQRGNRTLFDGFNLSLRAGERIALTGPSGIGKTSLLDVLAGLLPPTKGRVERASSVARTGIQKLYQDPPAAFPTRVTLGDSLRDVARLHRFEWSAVEEVLMRLKISSSLLQRCPDAVSGGELQRISVARALTTRPSVLLADEPTSRLDPITQRETMDLIAEISREMRIAVVLVTHDLTMSERWADRVLHLR